MKPAFKNADEAVEVLINASQQHAKATETGHYKIANTNFRLIDNAVHYLLANDESERLKQLLTYHEVSVVVWVASYLIKQNDKQAIAVLEVIASGNIPHHSFDAKFILKNNLR